MTDGPSGESQSRSRAWEAARRALGRLFARASVRSLPDGAMMPAVRDRTTDALAAPPLSPGRDERGWKPVAAVRCAAVPEAGVGARDGDLRPVVRLTERDHALLPPQVLTMPVVQSLLCRIGCVDLLQPPAVIGLPAAFLALPPVRVRTAALLGPSQTLPLRGWVVAAPRAPALRLPRLAAPRVHWGGDAVLGRMGLSRRARAVPRGVPGAQALQEERLRLAEAADLPPDEVTLLGVFDGVPILAVGRIVVADDGRLLRLWLKPEVLRARPAPRLITLLVGRHDRTGKMLQAAL